MLPYKKMKKLTERQQKYKDALKECDGDHIEACRRAGYKSPEAAAYANANNVALQAAIGRGVQLPLDDPEIKPEIEKPTLGRPIKDIDMEEVKKLCGIHCTKAEVAGWFNVSDDTIERRCKSEGFTWSEYFERFSASGKISLRRKQFQVAIDGNVSMLIWLGKQFLGQTDTRQVEMLNEKDTKDDWLKKLSDDDLVIIEDILKKYDDEPKPEND